jgi:glycosyltransferase involved in cell wall biosynthesis
MRLAIVIYGELNQKTGGYLYDQKFVDYLRSCGDTVEVISLPDRGYLQNVFPRALHHIHDKLLNGSFDAIIFDELCHPSLSAWLPGIRKKQCCIGLVHHLKSSEPQGQLLKATSHLLEKQFLNTQHALICNSETTRRTCEELMSNVRPFQIVTPGPVTWVKDMPASAIEERAERPGPLRILFLGTLTKRKGLHTLIEALDSVTTPTQCSIIGCDQRDPTYADHCKSMVTDETIHQVDFLGELQDDALLEHMRRSHVLAVPSEYEGFGMAYLEGLSAGLPALATTEGAPPEFITHGCNGFLTPPNNAAKLGEHIQALAHDSKLLATMGIAARQSFDDHPTWNESFQGARDFILQISNERRPTDASLTTPGETLPRNQ